MEFLPAQNKVNAGDKVKGQIRADGKHVIVIGGGDTGSDCVGTSNRHGAASVTQFELMPQPPVEENRPMTWPDWPIKLRTSSSHQEGCCLLYTSDAADDLLCVDLGGRRIIKKKKQKTC